MRNAAPSASSPDDAVIEVPAVIGPTGRRRCPSRRSRRCCAAWSGTCRRTRSSRWTRRCAAAGERVASALLAHPLIGQHDLAERMADRLIAENQRFLAWA